MAAGGGIVVGIGREPRPDGAAPDAPSLLFDWTALETAAECLKHGFPAWPAEFGLPIVVASSEKSVTEIPDNRRPLYEELLRSGLLHVESIMPGSRAAAFLRQRQAVFGDALVILGGGTGVEHLADCIYRAESQWCLLIWRWAPAGMTAPAARCAWRRKRERNLPFLRFGSAYASTEGAALAEIATRNGSCGAPDVATGT